MPAILYTVGRALGTAIRDCAVEDARAGAERSRQAELAWVNGEEGVAEHLHMFP